MIAVLHRSSFGHVYMFNYQSFGRFGVIRIGCVARLVDIAYVRLTYRTLFEHTPTVPTYNIRRSRDDLSTYAVGKLDLAFAFWLRSGIDASM